MSIPIIVSIATAALALAMYFFAPKVNGKVNKRNVILVLFIALFALTFDIISKSKSNTSEKLENQNPLLEIGLNPNGVANPLLRINELPDRFMILTTLLNNSNTTAKNINSVSNLVELNGNEIKSTGTPVSNAFNETIYMGPHNTKTIKSKYRLASPVESIKSRIFYCLRVSYANSSDKLFYWEGIYEITNFPFEQQLEIPNSDIYKKIKAYLFEEEIWK